ncbi:anhydro-N-acetylmuramic acid kinase [Paraglaciecola aquimarina]|uniref:Anhydro-N-acetylmuramic acid kinase n=1 Tax=Paraglaciecola algarum TaxID=3050085 RepID=A0ABS9DBX0_9ALTE|nr:anhydro-N-acetylmuramic acid kinase [Paraglaciecola sp. G1-23]MCF2949522.1 anhydro-N-acetylmuramic acid kinase [Paraglaciecola sp. G1-23]
MSQFYLGLMSGTSMDGVDVAIVDFSELHPRLLDCQTYPYPPELLSDLHRLCKSSDNEIELMGRADRAVAKIFADASLQLLKSNYINQNQVIAIGSHGQTIRHIPEGTNSFSIQIGDPNTIAALTGIDVIADFRRKDIALGGQGAPLVPAFHQAIFSHKQKSRVVVNIGGISNLTYLPKNPKDKIIGFDTGPGNTLLDMWCHKHTGKEYDDKGKWAAQSSADPELLLSLLSHPYFSAPAPKSTGRELFNLAWLEQHIAQLSHTPNPQMVQATLVALTTRSITEQVIKFKDVEEVYICGGGARNEFLLEELESELHECELFTTDELGVTADAVEAMAFAWLAYAHVNKMPGNIASATGASKEAILGTSCPAN